MKKQLALGMALLLGISSLTACGGGAAATTAAPAAAAETKAAETKAEAAETKAEETKAEAGETKAAPAGAAWPCGILAVPVIRSGTRPG